MKFLTANIDRAIVMTQYDLRGFFHALGFRIEKNTPKSLDAITCNLTGFAAGFDHVDSKPTDDAFANYHSSSFEDYLAMCKQLAKDCDLSQMEAIQLIILEIIKQSEGLKAEVAAGKREASHYLKPLKKNNQWGKAVLALAEAFKVKLELVTA